MSETTSIHYSLERHDRDDLITNIIGLGNIVDSFVVDKGHPNGAELHSVTDTGIIIIHNQKTGKLITELVGRPEQIKKLYRTEGREPPKYILKKAYSHNAKNYNRV